MITQSSKETIQVARPSSRIQVRAQELSIKAKGEGGAMEHNTP